jgi:xylulose-5-phosphate/fructose-6-phosphate phosphoketolase
MSSFPGHCGKEYIARHGNDMPAIAGWRWSQGQQGGARVQSTEGDNV